MSERTGLRNLARAVIIAAGSVFIVSLFLVWIASSSGRGPSVTAFEILKRGDVVLLAIAVVAIALALIDFAIKDKRWLTLAGLLGLFPLGWVSITAIETYSTGLWGIGFWLALVASFAWAVGGVLALASEPRE